MEKILFYRRLLLPVFIFLWGAQLCHAQTQTTGSITLKKANVTLADVFQSVKKQTGLTVFYSNNLLNDRELVTVDFQNASVQDVFTFLLKGKSLRYVLRDQLIVIEKAPMEKPAPTPAKKE